MSEIDIHPLQQARRKLGIKQKVLADLTGLSEPTIKRAESGRPLDDYTIAAICDYFSVRYGRGIIAEELGLHARWERKETILENSQTTFNTINKWAQGITDTLALGILCEYMGLGIPIIAIPCVPESLACHPAFSKNTALLKKCGVYVLYDPQKYPPMNNIPWQVILDAVTKLRKERATEGVF